MCKRVAFRHDFLIGFMLLFKVLAWCYERRHLSHLIDITVRLNHDAIEEERFLSTLILRATINPRSAATCARAYHMHLCAACIKSQARVIPAKKLLKQGCPSQFRGKLWGAVSGGFCAMNSNPDYYKTLLADFNMYPNPCFKKIELATLFLT